MVKEIIALFRVKQWYKNLVVFLPILFLARFFDMGSLARVLLAFAALCFVSSANYIINDIRDFKLDKLNPEKKGRPIASGKVGFIYAILLASILALISFLIGLYIGGFLPIFALFVIGQAYTFWLKNEAFVDVLVISVNFVLRAVTGSVVLNASISPWLVLCTFFLALFLAVGKRESEINLLGATSLHRKVLGHYTKEITNSLMIISTTSLIIAYSLYSFLSNFNLLWTLPFALYVFLRYVYLIYSGSAIARHPEMVVRDARMMIGILLWIALTTWTVYC